MTFFCFIILALQLIQFRLSPIEHQVAMKPRSRSALCGLFRRRVGK